MKKTILILAVILLCLAYSASDADDFMIKWINWNEYNDLEKNKVY